MIKTNSKYDLLVSTVGDFHIMVAVGNHFIALKHEFAIEGACPSIAGGNRAIAVESVMVSVYQDTGGPCHVQCYWLACTRIDLIWNYFIEWFLGHLWTRCGGMCRQNQARNQEEDKG